VPRAAVGNWATGRWQTVELEHGAMTVVSIFCSHAICTAWKWIGKYIVGELQEQHQFLFLSLMVAAFRFKHVFDLEERTLQPRHASSLEERLNQVWVKWVGGLLADLLHVVWSVSNAEPVTAFALSRNWIVTVLQLTACAILKHAHLPEEQDGLNIHHQSKFRRGMANQNPRVYGHRTTNFRSF
jgi:hypothetical protein